MMCTRNDGSEDGSFSISSMIRRYRIYKEVWEVTEGEILSFKRENDNYHNPFSVAVVKDGQIVGHVPKKISTVCSLFLRQGGNIVCTVTEHRRYSQDLPQGGLEVPCTLSFSGENTYIEKAKHCLQSAELSVNINTTTEDHPRVDTVTNDTEVKSHAVAKIQNSEESTEVVQVIEDDEFTQKESVPIWLQKGKIVLQCTHKRAILEDSMLNDIIINAAQLMLREQFPDVFGFQSTLLLKKEQPRYQSDKVYTYK